MPRQSTNRHHRKARMYGGSDDPENLIEVCVKKHTSFHALFPDPHPRQVAKRLWVLLNNATPKQKLHLNRLFKLVTPTICLFQLNNIWIDPEWKIFKHKDHFIAERHGNF